MGVGVGVSGGGDHREARLPGEMQVPLLPDQWFRGGSGFLPLRM